MTVEIYDHLPPKKSAGSRGIFPRTKRNVETSEWKMDRDIERSEAKKIDGREETKERRNIDSERSLGWLC